MQAAAAKATSAGRARPVTGLLTGTDEAALVGEDDGLSAVAQRELHQDAADVGLDRLLRDDQVGGDLRVRQAAGDEGQHFGLAFGQVLEVLAAGGPGRAQAGELRDQAAGHPRSQQRVAGRDHPHGLGELASRGVLEQEAAGAGAQRLVHVVVQVEGGQNQDPGRAVAGRRDLPGGLQAVEHRHADIHEDDVGAQLSDPGDGLLPVDGLADHLDVGLGVEQDGKARPHHALVVGHDHADRHGASSSDELTGRVAVTWNPPSSRGPASRLPPSMVARSRMPTRPWPPPTARAPLATRTGAVLLAGGRASLRISSTRLSGQYARCSRTWEPGACRIALLSASCRMRYADRSTPPGSVTGFPLRVTVTDTPPLRAESSRASRSASPGWGAVSRPSVRSTPSTRRSSVSPASALARISPKLSTSCGGGSAVL